MKQSSIEWLIDTMRRSAGYDQNQIDGIFEHAIASHKVEIKNSYHDGRMSMVNKQVISAEEYYNETFNTKNK